MALETKKEGNVVSSLAATQPLPKMVKIKQLFDHSHYTVEEIPGIVYKELDRPELRERIRPGMHIAITCGSRGVANIAIITKAIVDFVKDCGAEPFVFPSMGSHGGATAEGQVEILTGYGVTEDFLGCPIKSSMDTVEIGRLDNGQPVYVDKYAYEADGIILCGRVKAHTAFRGPYESGVCKMAVIGMGKQKGAESVHSDGLGNMARNLPANAKVVVENSNILFAIPCVENAYDETALIEAIPTEKIFEREPELLKIAFSNMPSILVKEADVLVVNEIGKNFSGTGVDPNISGTWSTKFGNGGLQVKRTCFLDLRDSSHGNANGMGLADVITKRIFDKLDLDVIYTNCFTSTVLRSGMMPPVVYDDKEAIQACIRTANQIDREHARIVRIKNTLHIGEIMLSEAYYEDVKNGRYPGVTALDEPQELEFDEQGALLTQI